MFGVIGGRRKGERREGGRQGKKGRKERKEGRREGSSEGLSREAVRARAAEQGGRLRAAALPRPSELGDAQGLLSDS